MINFKNKKRISSNKLKSFLVALLRYCLLIGLGFIIIYPLITKISITFMSESDTKSPIVWLIPMNPTLENIQYVIEEGKYFSSLITTVCIALGCALAQTASCTLVGYGLARFKFRGQGILLALVVFTIVVPPATLSTSLFVKFRYFDFYKVFESLFDTNINLIDTVIPILILSLTALGLKNGLYILIMWQRFRGIPKELSEAAFVDGANNFKTFFNVIMPQTKAMMISIFILSFAWQWTDSFYNRLFFNKIPVLSNMISQITIGYEGNTVNGVGNAGLLLLIVPLLLTYLFVQRYLIQGVEQSGIVG